MLIRYIGRAPTHADLKFGSGVAWTGPGNVQPVPDEIAARMVVFHPDVYEEAPSLDTDWSRPPDEGGAGAGEAKGPTVKVADMQIPEPDGSSSPLASASLGACIAYLKLHRPMIRTDGLTVEQCREAITRLLG